MNTFRRGSSTLLALAIVVGALVIAAGVFYYVNALPQPEALPMGGVPPVVAPEEKSPINANDERGVAMEESSVETSTEAMVAEAPPVAYQGTRLAGSATTPLIDFNAADYQAAKNSGSVVVLYFYADWCPICRAEFPKMQAAFDQLDGKAVVGFRVNYKDNATDDVEEDLAREFGVSSQHTKIFLKDGQRVLKSPETWSTDRYLQEINAL